MADPARKLVRFEARRKPPRRSRKPPRSWREQLADTGITPATPIEQLPGMLLTAEVAAWLRLGRDEAYLFAQQHGRRISRQFRIPRGALALERSR
jgi:hypothetical protein